MAAKIGTADQDLDAFGHAGPAMHCNCGKADDDPVPYFTKT